MLTGESLSFFYTLSRNNSFSELCTLMLNHYEGPESKINATNKWNSLNLLKQISSEPQKPTSEQFEIFLSQLRKLKYKLPDDQQTDQFLHMKLMTACREVPGCVLACYKPATDLPTFINDLRNSIGTKETSPITSESYYTDRKYHSNTHQRGKNSSQRGYHKYISSKPRPHGNFKETSNNGKDQGRCWICKKEGCRSYYYPESEVKRARENFHKRVDQYLAEYDDYLDSLDTEKNENFTESDNENEIYDNLILDIKTPKIENNSTKSQPPSHDPTNDLYFSSIDSTEEIARNLTNNLFLHLITNIDNTTENIEKPESNTDKDNFNLNHQNDHNKVVPDNDVNIESFSNARYSQSKWFGILIDTGAANRSTVGYNQYIAFKNFFGTLLDESPQYKIDIRFGIGIAKTIGVIHAKTPIGLVDFYVAHSDTPFLLSLSDLDKLKIYFNSVDDLISTSSNKKWTVIRRYGHAWLLWDAPLISLVCESFLSNPCLLTEVELRRLPKRFGLPSSERLRRLLESSNHEVDIPALEKLTRFCSHCQKNGKSPGRFRFTLRDEIEFNYTILVDIMYIGTSPVLHIVDEYTRFQAARWLENVSAKHTWDQLRSCWIDTYLGPPDLITHDAGKNFISQEFKQYAHDLGITTKTTPIEAHWSIGVVESYHTMLRRAFGIISVELPELNRDMQLQMAVKAINDTAEPNGLVPTLLVFGAYPRMTKLDAPSPSIASRIAALKKPQVEIKKVRADRLIANALNHRNGPSKTAIHDLPINSNVLVFREGNGGKSGSRKGPYKLIAIEGENAIVNINSQPTPFRTTTVWPFLTDPSSNHDTTIESTHRKTSNEDPHLIDTKTIIPVTPPPVLAIKKNRGRPRKYPLNNEGPQLFVYLQENFNPNHKHMIRRSYFGNDIKVLKHDIPTGTFIKSRKIEVEGLMDKGVFKFVHKDNVPRNERIFNSRFVDTIKNPGTSEEIEKSRLVIQAWGDDHKGSILTQSPTIQRVSQRMILALAMVLPNVKLYSREIMQAYVQSRTKLQRSIYARLPINFGIPVPKDHILIVVRPLYGIAESGNHWFGTYHKYHTTKLDMHTSTFDFCLLYCKTNGFEIIGLQTDDTLILADADFAAKEEEKLREENFMCKERKQLTEKDSFKFNGELIGFVNGQLSLTQEHQCNKINKIDSDSPTMKQDFVAQRARGAYVASVCQPEASFELSFAVQVSNPSHKDMKALNSRLAWQMKNKARGLKYVKLDINSLGILIFTDASFANNPDLTSQIGYIIVLADANNKANILDWSSTKCKRVTRSVLASELYAMVHGFDIGSAIKATLDTILGKSIPLVACTDSKSLDDCLVKLGTTQEKRLMVDVMSLRQSYENREIPEVKWIEGHTNPADAMTKSKAGSALISLIDSNTINLQITEWVERPSETGP